MGSSDLWDTWAVPLARARSAFHFAWLTSRVVNVPFQLGVVLPSAHPLNDSTSSSRFSPLALAEAMCAAVGFQSSGSEVGALVSRFARFGLSTVGGPTGVSLMVSVSVSVSVSVGLAVALAPVGRPLLLSLAHALFLAFSASLRASARNTGKAGMCQPRGTANTRRPS